MKDASIIYVGVSGFPTGFAMIEKIKLISLALQEQGYDIVVLNRKWSDGNSKLKGEIRGIKYINALGIRHRPKDYIRRNIYKFILPFKEARLLIRIAKRNSTKYFFVNSRSIGLLLQYYLIAKALNIKLVITYVEHGSSMVTKSKFSKISDILFERFAFKLVDAALPISDYLTEIIRKQNKSLPILKTPVLTDIEFINTVENNKGRYAFVFCGAAAFIEVISFVIESYSHLEQTDIELLLICGGTDREKRVIKDLIKRSTSGNRIELRFGLSYLELIKCYKSSFALLIPLRPTLQDLARFPHKIGEYAATGRPIISIQYGEIANYFSDGYSALLASEYNTHLFAEKMNFVIQNPKLANQIGLNGKNVAEKNFGYKQYGKKLVRFLNRI